MQPGGLAQPEESISDEDGMLGKRDEVAKGNSRWSAHLVKRSGIATGLKDVKACLYGFGSLGRLGVTGLGYLAAQPRR